MLNTLKLQERIDAGRIVERNILKVINDAGISVTLPTVEEDKYDKIDGWIQWKGKNNRFK